MEPERKIEKLLRAFAKKRRDDAGAPLELHPVNRRLLQDEAARRAPKRSAANFSFLALLRPKLAIILPVVVICLIGIVLLPSLSSNKSQRAGMREMDLGSAKEKADMPATFPPAAPAGSSTKQVALESKSRDEFRSNDQKVQSLNDGERKNLAQSVAPATAPVSATAPRIATESGSNLKTFSDFSTATPTNGSLVAQANVATGTETYRQFGATTFGGGAGGGGGGGGFEELAKRSSVRFYRVVNDADAMASRVPAQPVPGKPNADLPAGASNRLLASFAVEQNGRELRIVDSDGSVYRGYLQLENSGAGRRASATRDDSVLVATPPARNQPEPAGALVDRCTFEVSGTNSGLGQNVVFSGVLSVTNGVLLEGLNAGVAGQAISASGNFPQVHWSNSHITGTALIGNARKVEIQAAPVPGIIGNP